MAKVFDATEVAKHNTAESCWVILYGNVYDVTEFLPSHPGGTRAILQLAGRDCTEDFDPIHPPGTLDELKPEAKLGAVDPESLKKLQQSAEGGGGGSGGSGGNNGSGGDDDDGNDKEVKQVVKKEEKFVCPPLESILNLDEMETVATKLVPRKAWSYYYSAGDDLASKRLNNTVYRQVLLRPRVFVDCTDCSTATTLLDGRLSVGVPVFVSPAAMARLGHPDGEAGIARGVSRFGALQIVSHNASMTVEQIAAAAAETPGQVLGWQIYVQKDRRKSEAMLARINGLPQYRCVVLTLDAPVPGKREDDERQQFGTNASFAAATQDVKAQPAGAGIGRQMFFGTATDLTWTATLPWLAAHTPLPIVLKGIQTHEDAFLAARYAAAHPGTVRAIILSNHGGRSLDTAPPALHTLLEIRKYCPAVFEHVEVWLDGGIRRGTDVVKALCLGARAVGVGRAALWGLGAGGTKGVDRAFEILSDEIKTCMRLLGVHAIADLNPRLVNTRALERDIFDGGSGLDQLAMPLPVQAKL